MSDKQLCAAFAHEDDLLAATEEAGRRGLRIVDAYTPYAVHGLDRALGLRPSPLTWVCFGGGMIGALGMLWFQHWTASVDWALNVGGKPWNSLPSDVPVAFEAAVLLAAFGSVFALFAVSRLFPGRQPNVIHPRASDDRFVLVIDAVDPLLDADSMQCLFQPFDLVEIYEQLAPDGEEMP